MRGTWKDNLLFQMISPDTHIRLWTMSLLIMVVIYEMPFDDTKLILCQVDTYKYISVKFESNNKSLSQKYIV